MTVVAIVQARMGSTRLPGKVLMDLGGQTVLTRVVWRLRRAHSLAAVVVATSTAPGDEAIMRECERLQVPCSRGSEQDVLDRYYHAARDCNAEAVVRITSDCPLIDPELVDQTVRVFLGHGADYASNVFPRTYPRGLDTEIFTRQALDRAWREATEPHQREHVTPYFYEHPELFKLVSTQGTDDYSAYRWTLDTPEDWQLITAIYSRFNNDDFTWRDALALMQREPQLAQINSQVRQKAVRAG